MKDKNTKKTKRRVYYGDVKAVLHSCDVSKIFFIHGIAAAAACFPVAEEDKRDNTDKMDKSDNRRQHRPK